MAVKTYPKEKLLKLYHDLLLTRQFEQRLSILYRQGKIVGGLYLSRGQEAIPVATCQHLRKDDFISPVHRDLGAFLVKGMDPGVLMAQILAKQTGPSKGKDSFLHAGSKELGIIPPTSILASTIPIAAGVAFGFKIRGEDRVAVSYFGEGGSNRGDFHEGLNFAGLHKPPLVLICENNKYAYSTPVEKEMAICCVAYRAESYGFEGLIVDGNDALAVYDTMEYAVNKAREGGGPTLIECMTYRISGHSEHDEAKYQPPEEKEIWKRRDPIENFRKYLTDRGQLDESEDQRIQTQIAQTLDKAVAFAEQSPYPPPEDALRHVFANEEPKYGDRHHI
ncbi:MAG: thiamine pyrophosphate-dependent dehydrogenase E1 component subunit alpha [Candidatus Abyssobacteria bacterium SURF_5]|uniref:2-oxoisovalerate dehydrogenase subunit alpha n=1 Tax=Abyssobacteria bacterium (strain SURF_5) TaxID=2093360 RepID=A0A3A4P0K4_ABYX5|nr:MAG: thiamine pyrophosphate-dependent dehydrogenase E1 component subunit alpha [Candidatus Abyssubacteria bacterium SURF_5]